MIKVTFDTNTFDMATRPQVYAKDPNHADFVKVHEAVKDGRIKGFLCDAIVTLEGSRWTIERRCLAVPPLRARGSRNDPPQSENRAAPSITATSQAGTAVWCRARPGDEVSRSSAYRHVTRGGAQRQAIRA
jgi:hypothetical protein